ncbi:exported hypothetical protein [Candidatus Sulfopaludibacter sp. SbA3]|nr:exported hypothetical protein [Candidatus Sulfopaludibacter sp. SbA3]
MARSIKTCLLAAAPVSESASSQFMTVADAVLVPSRFVTFVTAMPRRIGFLEIPVRVARSGWSRAGYRSH